MGLHKISSSSINYTIFNVVASIAFLGIVAMWFMILALPAFNRFSMKKRFRLHVLQFVYSTIQVVSGAIFAQDHF